MADPAPDHFAEARLLAAARRFSPPEQVRLERLLQQLAARGVEPHDARVPRYTAPLFARGDDTPYPAASSGSAGTATTHGAVVEARRQPRDWKVIGRALLCAAALWLCLRLSGDRDRSHDPKPVTPPPPPLPGSGSPTTALPPPLRGITIAHYPLIYWLIFGLVLTFVVYLAWTRIARLIARWRKQRLRRDTERDPAALIAIAVRDARAQFFAAPGLAQSLHKLRRHRAIPSPRIDVGASIRATIDNGAIPVLRFARRRLSPDYLLFSERERPQDHLSAVAAAWQARLSAAGIACAHYEFFGDPHTLRAVSGPGSADGETLDALLAGHPDARLMVMMEGFDAIAQPGATPRWINVVHASTAPSLMNPREPRHWASPELRLGALGVPGFTADAQGVADFAEQIDRSDDGEEVESAPATPGEPDLAAYFAEHRIMLLSPTAPPEAQRAAVIATLEQWLDKDAFDWLCALALFPVVTIGFTLFAGGVLKDSSIVTHRRYLAIARLPWLRVAYMPDWLRQSLVGAMTPFMLQRAAAMAAAFLDPPLGGIGSATDLLELRREAETRARKRGLAKRLEGGEHPVFNDRLLIEALRGKPPETLSVTLGGDFQPPPQSWWRRPEVHALAAATILWMAILALNFDAVRLWPPAIWSIEPPQLKIGPRFDESALTPRSNTQPQVPPKSQPSVAVAPLKGPTKSPASPATEKALTLYIQIPDEQLRGAAERLIPPLARITIDGLPLDMPGIEVRPKDSPQNDELRCFNVLACKRAREIAKRLGGYPTVVPSEPASTSQLELWLGSKGALEKAKEAADAISGSLAAYFAEGSASTPSTQADKAPQSQQAGPQKEEQQQQQAPPSKQPDKILQSQQAAPQKEQQQQQKITPSMQSTRATQSSQTWIQKSLTELNDTQKVGYGYFECTKDGSDELLKKFLEQIISRFYARILYGSAFGPYFYVSMYNNNYTEAVDCKKKIEFIFSQIKGAELTFVDATSGEHGPGDFLVEAYFSLEK